MSLINANKMIMVPIFNLLNTDAIKDKEQNPLRELLLLTKPEMILYNLK